MCALPPVPLLGGGKLGAAAPPHVHSKFRPWLLLLLLLLLLLPLLLAASVPPSPLENPTAASTCAWPTSGSTSVRKALFVTAIFL